ncbi:rhomboid family intramembrane serine protease [Parapedobacter sp. ISTM3]|uniref:Membrane associated serine protease, rhomboid family n=1 Tax=Parapedobacter luteus TaxID=623280 RepID=A0A1T5DMD9_9SPHI|nr:MULTISPECIES: rhomboid family intramembrane serine protease [Parapedobacter]MBK1440946.1 rhomboid family intramembrane serine protease [Parapedobacter sp. ISTM3]SKB72771.1 Membrane associated serine protease, rhomboid family [Parapedobacter luteus]
MLLPIGDENHDRRSFPFINYLLIGINIFVFVFFQGFGYNIQFTFSYATIPAEILTGKDIVTESQLVVDPISGTSFEMPGLQRTDIPVFLTLITAMFMHGGIGHLAGNMLYLWICGDNVEDRLGHFRYLIFYLLCGILSGLSHVFTTLFFGQNLLTPCLGASGAISAVLAGYMVLFPRKRITIWMFFLVFSVPAIVAIGLWFLFQVSNGLGALGGEQAGGVAYAAHIGGFIAGLLLVNRFRKRITYARA